MTHRWTLRRSVVFVALFATYFLRAQESGSWEDNFHRGSEEIRAGRYTQARPFLEAALEQARSFDANDERRAQTKAVLATAYQLQGDVKLAGALYAEARAILEANGDSGKATLAFVLDGFGELRFEEGRWEEAEQLLKQARALHDQIDGKEAPATMTVVRHLAELYTATGRNSEAEELLKQAVAVFRKSERSAALAASLVSLGHLYLVEGRYDLAGPALKEALVLDTKTGDQHPSAADTMVNLAVFYRVENKPDRAQPLLRKAERIYRDAGDPRLAGVLNEQAFMALRGKKYTTAEKILQEALDIVTKAFGAEHVCVALVEVSLAETYLAESDYAKAESFIRRALEKERISLGDSSFAVAKSLLIAAQIEDKLNRQPEAQSDYREAVALYGKSIGADHPEALHAQEMYTRFVKRMRK